MLPVGVDERPQIEVREVVGVAGQEELFALDPLPVGDERAGAAEQFRLEDRADRRRPGARGEVAAHHVRQVMEVDQDLVDPRAVERVEPDVEQGPAADGQHALRGGVGDRPQPAADSRGEQEGLHASGLPDDAEGAHPRVRLGQHAVEAVHALEPGGVGRDRSAGVRRGSQPSARRALMSERMWRVSPNRYSPVTTPGSVGAVLAHDDVGELPGGDRPCRRRR